MKRGEEARMEQVRRELCKLTCGKYHHHIHCDRTIDQSLAILHRQKRSMMCLLDMRTFFASFESIVITIESLVEENRRRRKVNERQANRIVKMLKRLGYNSKRKV